MKKTIFYLILIICLFSCGKKKKSEGDKKANIEITFCTAIPSNKCGYESSEGSPFCEIVVIALNKNKETVHNIVVEVKVPNIFGAILLTKNVDIGTIEPNKLEQGSYPTTYDLKNMAEFQCKVL